MNSLDWFLLALAVLALWSGYRRGALHQVFSLGGLLLGLVAGVLLAPAIASAIGTPAAGPPIAIATMLLGAALGTLAGRLIGGRVRSVAHKTPLRPVDKVIGGLVGISIFLAMVWLLSYNLVAGPSQELSKAIEGSQVIRTLDTVLPEPPAILGQVRTFVDRFGFPQVFTGLPPDPGGPVDPPTEEAAARAFTSAADSTMQIFGEACGRIQEGSGFVVEEGLVLTNAHVLAGVARPQVRDADGRGQDGTVVLFDPELDVALVRVDGALGPQLDLSDSEPPRGAGGVVAGYPGGGTLTGTKAAARRTISAVGRDIYGSGEVQRRVIELQAAVRPGNSGGPFVLEDGTVAGVVFAASPSDPKIGYAIAAPEVQGSVDEAAGRVDAVATGRCVP